ncbi:HK97 gp10 family phage protein [Stenotrophomonas sp. HITSZ_GD]|uniref:HK97 gp10 family phage protein n=1 Tax=Stenotrophomonas sp. HITSZ_GD TaxID=3037248 RepID=UPI00240D4FE6|nr:HK97 gp10 family phage protein [Stenotrophomonas sp. HITSZ_GD]MDG2524645.1 HK97 gp10 family phage protein [Stenotrophomonas sp. HITSZ_GD]
MASRVNLSSALAGLDNLGEMTTSVARSMGVAAGQAVRGEAKARAPVDDGTLRDSIYLAYREGESSDARVVYQISWNSKKAPHGHLLEFGHWRTNVLVRGEDGKWRATTELLPAPVWTPAYPFLRPAYEATLARLTEIAAARGRKRLAELLSGEGEGDAV